MKIQFGLTYKALVSPQNMDGYAADLINGYRLPFGEREQFIKNVGLTSFATGFSGTLQGVYETIAGRVLVVAGGYVYEVSSSGAITVFTGSMLTSATPAIFAEDASNVFVAHGGYIAKLDCSAKTVALLSSGPDNVTYVAVKKGYLLANGLVVGGVAGDINYSDDQIGGYATWEVFNNEQSPDACTALVVGWDAELYAFGTKSVELSINGTDPDNPWEALPGAVMEYGTSAPYSVVLADNTLFWLTTANGRRGIVKMVNRSPVLISSQYDNIIADMQTVSDARAWIQSENDQSFYVITFPTEDRTFQFNLMTGEWSEKAFWDVATSSYKRYKGAFGAYIEGWNVVLVADHTSYILYKLYGTSDNGSAIRMQLTSGNNEFGSASKKANKFDIFSFLCGVDTDVSIRYRDDSKMWGNPRAINLGGVGETESYRRIRKSGVFRSRQYEIVHSGDSSFIFLGGEAIFEMVGR